MYVCMYVYMYICVCIYVCTEHESMYVLNVYLDVCICMYVCMYVLNMYVCKCTNFVCMYVFDAHLVEQGSIEGRLSGCGEKHDYFETRVFRFTHFHVVLQELNQDTHLLIQRHGQIPLRHLQQLGWVGDSAFQSSKRCMYCMRTNEFTYIYVCIYCVHVLYVRILHIYTVCMCCMCTNEFTHTICMMYE